jgi:hypothetical protein
LPAADTTIPTPKISKFKAELMKQQADSKRSESDNALVTTEARQFVRDNQPHDPSRRKSIVLDDLPTSNVVVERMDGRSESDHTRRRDKTRPVSQFIMDRGRKRLG